MSPWWILVFFVVGIWFGMGYRWLEVQNLTIQLFIQCNEFEIERQQLLDKLGVSHE